MSKNTNDWMIQLGNLPPEDRAELVIRLIESLDEPVDTDWEAAWAAELQKRSERRKNGIVTGIAFD